MSEKFLRDLKLAALEPSDPNYQITLRALEDLNQKWGDIDDEILLVLQQLKWLSSANWFNHRPYSECVPFVDECLANCDLHLASIRKRWSIAKSRGGKTG